MRKIRPLLLLFPFLSLYLVSCTKTGPQGPQGTAGTNGTNGSDGNASVFTDTLTVEGTEWANGGILYVAENSGITTQLSTKYYDVPFDKITSGVIDSGMVSVYFTPYESDQWLEIPFSYNPYYYQINYAYAVTPGNVRLHIYLSPGSSTPPPNIFYWTPSGYHFKIVAVAGNLD